MYQIHFPNSWSNTEYWDGLADVYDAALVCTVSMSNYGSEALCATHAALSKQGIKLMMNQIQLLLLYRWLIENGIMDTCKELDVQVLSYSPLALIGFLMRKYSKDNLPLGPRKELVKPLFESKE